MASCWCGVEHEGGHPGAPTALAGAADRLKMGLVSESSTRTAHLLTRGEAELALAAPSEALTPEIDALRAALAQEAGGMDAAMAAAFGPRAEEFFVASERTEAGRRAFLKQIALVAALAGTGTFGWEEAQAQSTPTGPLEKKKLRIGFIPITCATPIIMAKPLDFYSKYGLDVELVKMPSWAAVRDAVIAGELDASHMLSPMPLAISLGLGSAKVPIKLASIENINGQAITVAKKYLGKVKGPADFKGFKIGVPFQYSMHNLLLRYYLATGKINPDKDVQIISVPPPDSVSKLIVGELDAMLMPDPFNQRAVYQDAGFIHLLTKDLWPGHPCCAFAAQEAWIKQNPNTFRAVNKAIIDAALFAHNKVNRKAIAKAIAPKNYLNQPEEVVAAVLTGEFEDGTGQKRSVPDRIDFAPYPWRSYSGWILTQFERWGYGKNIDIAGTGKSVFLTETARDLQKELNYPGVTPPSKDERVEKLKYDTFNPAEPQKYLAAQIKQYGA
ncbi:MAG: ABC transporter substrate-binding protein [Gemmatimonadaceae bacterium]|nr:ABC transporter substrate-binding protein [Gloeobacterales cyanobacterium ES-bin-141]